MGVYHQHKDDIQPVYDSMESCSTELGIPVVALKAAKKGGCAEAFRNGRIYIAPFIRWLFSESKEKAEQDWANYEKKFKALTAEVTYQTKKELVVEKQKAKEIVTQIIGGFFQSLDRMEIEMPTALEGRDRVFIRAEIERVNAELRAKIKAEFKNL